MDRNLSLATLLELARTLPIDTIDRVTRGLMDPLPPRFRAPERIELFRCWFQTTEDILRGALVCFKILDLLADILKVSESESNDKFFTISVRRYRDISRDNKVDHWN